MTEVKLKPRPGKVPFQSPLSGSATTPVLENTNPSENLNEFPPFQKPPMTVDCVTPDASTRYFIKSRLDVAYRTEGLAPNSIRDEENVLATFVRWTPLSKTEIPPLKPLLNTNDCGLPGTTFMSNGD
jgi:hypothetical protein